MEISTHIANGIYNVTLSGKFTFNDNPLFREVIETLAQPGITRIVIHLAQVDFVDSAALGMLLLTNDEARIRNQSLVLTGVTGQVKRVFEMARFDQFFQIQ